MKLYQSIICLLYLLSSIDSSKGQVPESTGEMVIKKVSTFMDNWPKLKFISFSFFQNNISQEAENIVGMSTVGPQEKSANQETEVTTVEVGIESTAYTTELVSEAGVTEVAITDPSATEFVSDAEVTEIATDETVITSETEVASVTSFETTESVIFETTEDEVVNTLRTTRRNVRTTRVRTTATSINRRTPTYQCVSCFGNSGRGKGRQNRRCGVNIPRRQITERRGYRNRNRPLNDERNGNRYYKNGRRVRTQRERQNDYDTAFNKWLRRNSAFYQNNDYIDNTDFAYRSDYDYDINQNVNELQIANSFITNYFRPYETFSRRNGFRGYKSDTDYQINRNHLNDGQYARNGFPRESTFISTYFKPYEQFSQNNRFPKRRSFISNYFSPYENFSRRAKFETVVLASPYWSTYYYEV